MNNHIKDNEDDSASSRRDISNVVYYNSINLLTDEGVYECELTLSFIKYNIHFNLKSDLDFNEYAKGSCEMSFIQKDDFKKFNFDFCPNE